jgi:signal transduction histidine kinase
MRPSRWLGRRLGRLRAVAVPAVDVAAAVVFVAAVALDRSQDPVDGGAAMVALSVVLTLMLAGGLVARRRVPLTAFVASSVGLSVEALAGISSAVSPYANLVGIYSLGTYATRRRALLGPPMAVVGTALYFIGNSEKASTFEVAGVLFAWIATWAVGYSNARRREEQERARRAARRQAIAEEQIRVARELHDVIGHTVNLLVVQAGAARLLLDSDPAKARGLLAGMEQTGRDSLADLDRVLGHLRPATPATEPHPSPGLAQIPDLVDRLTDARVRVTLTLDPALRLPRNLDVSAYRIVQEGLTNVLKHAAPCAATVDVHRDGAAVVVEVADDGPGLPDQYVPRRGLLGIAERVSLCGGLLEQGSGPGRGFTLRAVLPLP